MGTDGVSNRKPASHPRARGARLCRGAPSPLLYKEVVRESSCSLTLNSKMIEVLPKRLTACSQASALTWPTRARTHYTPLKSKATHSRWSGRWCFDRKALPGRGESGKLHTHPMEMHHVCVCVHTRVCTFLRALAVLNETGRAQGELQKPQGAYAFPVHLRIPQLTCDS